MHSLNHKEILIRRIAHLQRKKKRGEIRTIGPIRVDPSLRSQYKNLLVNFSDLINKKIVQEIKPLLDAISRTYTTNSELDDFLAAFFRVQGYLSSIEKFTMAGALRMLHRFNLKNKHKFASAFREKVGIDLGSVIQEQPIQDRLQFMAAENFNLIKSIREKQLERIKTMVLNQLAMGSFDEGKLLEEIRKQKGISERHAKFVAHDQAQKINASLNQIRAQEIGCNKYIWRNMNDRSVRGNPSGLYPNERPSHWAREGKEYSYDDPPADGNPGHPYGCRCYAEAVLPF